MTSLAVRLEQEKYALDRDGRDGDIANDGGYVVGGPEPQGSGVRNVKEKSGEEVAVEERGRPNIATMLDVGEKTETESRKRADECGRERSPSTDCRLG